MSLFRFEEDEGVVYLLSHPSESGFPASASQLVELIENSPYADFELLHNNIGNLFTPSDDDNDDSLVVARASDATITVRIDEANMVADASVTTACGGKMVSLAMASKALVEAGVRRGVNKDVLERFLGQQFEKSPGDTYSSIVAHGQRAKNGIDAKFVRLCATAQDRILAPQDKGAGKVDMRNLGAIITVNPGTKLMKKVPATEGEQGFTVFGDVLDPKPGRDFTLEVMEGTKLDPKDANVLIADSVGVPVAVARGMRVDDVLCYDNVDVSTGHIEFDGSVIVSGDVRDGMKIKASGDITVIGFVESSELISESAITIMQGAIGRKRTDGDDFSCIIKSARTVSIGYAQYCHIESQHDIFIDKQALHCDLSSRRLIRIGRGDTPRGKLIGGHVLNALRIEAGEVGAPSGTKTKISIAQNFHDLRKKQIEFKSFEKRISEKVFELNRAKEKAVKSEQTNRTQAYLKKLSHSEAQLNQHYARNQRNIRLVQQKLARLLKTSRMKVNDLMHPGIEITIARDSKSFTRIYPPHSVKLDEGKITQKFNG